MHRSAVIRRLLVAALVAAGVCAFGMRQPDGMAGLLAQASERPFRAAGIAMLLMYLPLYLDGSERTAEGNVWPWFARLACWRRLVKYMSPSVRVDGPPIKAGTQLILAVHPHGVLTMNHVPLMTDTCGALREGLLPDPTVPFRADGKPAGWFRRELAATILFRIPIFRDIVLWLGNVEAGRDVAESILRKGGSLLLYPGGEKEQLDTQFGVHAAMTKKHLGFLKLALRFGLPVLPAYAFGEVDLYSTSSLLLGLRKALVNLARIALPIFWGRWGTVVPHQDVKLGVVVGKMIEVPRPIEKPTAEQIQELQVKYETELRRIFDDNKERYGVSADAEIKCY